MDIRIAIVEDTAEEQALLQQYIEQYCTEKGITVHIRLYENGEDFLNAYPDNRKPDLVFLDIEMPGINGMETARRLRSLDTHVQLIFITGLIQYAPEGYSVDAADYLVKPLSSQTFCAHFARVLEKMRLSAPCFLMTSYARENVSLQTGQISYIEALNKKTIIHMADGTSQFSSEPLYKLEEKLPDEAFFRCHNACLVNLAHVQSVTAEDLTVHGTSLPISKYRKKAFLEKLASYRGRLL